MFPSTYARFVGLFLGTVVLTHPTVAGSPPNDILNAPERYLRADTGWGGVNLANITAYDRSRTGTEDGCPVGWIECSALTCYPLDGSQCCSDGNFCHSGYYCDGDGCCRDGRICGGTAPPPSTIDFTSTPTSTRTRTSGSATASDFSDPSFPSTSVGFSAPAQSTVFGTVTVTMPSGGIPTDTAGNDPTSSGNVPQTDDAQATNPIGSNTGLNAAMSTRVGSSSIIAAVVAVVVCLA